VTGADEGSDQDIEYGREYVHTAEGALEEARKQLLSAGESYSWPNWSDGVPIILRRTVWSPQFQLGQVIHRHRKIQATVEFTWGKPRLLTELRENYGLLPSIKYTSQWYGVYRVFVPDSRIGRLCGIDPTGTIYIGRAGSERGWSILRTRIMQLAKREHHVTREWAYNDARQKKYPWSSLAVDWAYTEHWLNHKGERIIGAKRAERWLLDSYNEAFGEYPPLNQEG
jgi:hypothetical protein